MWRPLTPHGSSCLSVVFTESWLGGGRMTVTEGTELELPQVWNLTLRLITCLSQAPPSPVNLSTLWLPPLSHE